MRIASTYILIVTLFLSLSACQWGTIPDEEFQEKYGDRIKGRLGLSMFYGDEARNLAAKIRSELGENALIHDIILYYNRAIVTAQVPSDPSKIGHYLYEEGDWTADPSARPITKEQAESFFRASDLPLDRLPELVKQAQQALGEPDKFVRVVQVRLDRNYPDHLKLTSPDTPPEEAARISPIGHRTFAPDEPGINLQFTLGRASESSTVTTNAAGTPHSVIRFQPITPRVAN